MSRIRRYRYTLLIQQIMDQSIAQRIKNVFQCSKAVRQFLLYSTSIHDRTVERPETCWGCTAVMEMVKIE